MRNKIYLSLLLLALSCNALANSGDALANSGDALANSGDALAAVQAKHPGIRAAQISVEQLAPNVWAYQLVLSVSTFKDYLTLEGGK